MRPGDTSLEFALKVRIVFVEDWGGSSVVTLGAMSSMTKPKGPLVGPELGRDSVPLAMDSRVNLFKPVQEAVGIAYVQAAVPTGMIYPGLKEEEEIQTNPF